MIENPTIEYVKDFENIINILEVAVKSKLEMLASRVDYNSIPFNELGTNMSLPREERREVFLFLAIYGSALGSALTSVFVGVVGSPIPATLFTLLMLIASGDDYPVGIVVSTITTLRGLIYSIRCNDSEVGEIKAQLSAAFLNKVYAS